MASTNIMALPCQLILICLLHMSSALPNFLPSLALGQNSLAPAAVPSGFRTVLFYDDFSTASQGAPPSLSNWQLDTGTSYPGGPANWGTNEIQSYTSSPANIAVLNSTLRITPSLASSSWTSARIETLPAHDFSCPPGGRVRMEARIRLGAQSPETQKGIWPAFWSLGTAFRNHYNNWPSVGEIDIMETANGAARAWHTIHCGTLRAGPCEETTGIGGVSDLSRGEWHTFAAEIDRTASSSAAAGSWRDETLRWDVDGVTTMVVTGARVADRQSWESLAHSERFLLLNVAVGGSFPDALAGGRTPDSGTVGGLGAGMEVDYVGVFGT